jgi:hypothetical protein
MPKKGKLNKGTLRFSKYLAFPFVRPISVKTCAPTRNQHADQALIAPAQLFDDLDSLLPIRSAHSDRFRESWISKHCADVRITGDKASVVLPKGSISNGYFERGGSEPVMILTVA